MSINRRISIAPMMDWTDRHCRYFHRLISPHAFLYTEMIHANAITRGDTDKHLAFSEFEKPVALQLGGIDPKALADASKHGEDFGYAEINLNCGCPSDRVQHGEFGACLMAEPVRVAAAIAEMQNAVKIPVTVKTRLGIDEQESYEFLYEFVDTVHRQGGCDMFILHARKAWLKGLSPKENREKPPLDWNKPQHIKRDFPQLEIITNGGFETVEDIKSQFGPVDGVMIGRKAYHEPYFLAELEEEIFNNHQTPPRQVVVEKMIAYMEEQKAQGTYLRYITKHMPGLFHAQPVSKAWKHALMDAAKSDTTQPLQVFATV
jgi:tRNA-dihydrouridine synthase A